MDLRNYLIKNLKLTPAKHLDEASAWLGWYKGHVADFHDYNVYNGQKTIKRTRATMQMAKKVCEDWANLILNERVSITSNNKKFKTLLDDVLEYNAFYHRANQLIELTFALGTGALVEYIDSAGNVAIDYIREEMIYPLSWDNGDITECAFVSERVIDGDKYYYINVHTLEDSGYVITNKLVRQKDSVEVELPAGTLEIVETKSAVKRFQIIMPNIVNNVDLDSPFGISVFGNAIDRLKKVDLIFDSGNNEFALGRKRIIVPATMASVKQSEALNTPIFDSNDVAFTVFKTADESKVDKPVDLTTALRIDAHSKGMQDALNYLSDGCGLGNDRYEYTRAGGVKTATEIVSEKSALYQNLCKHELLIRDAIKDMAAAIADMAGFADVDVSVNFDDSIIEDKQSKQQQALLELNADIIDNVEYFIQVYGLSEEEAIKKVADIEARKKPLPDETMPLDLSVDM